MAMMLVVMHVHRNAIHVAIPNVTAHATDAAILTTATTAANIHLTTQLAAGHRQNTAQIDGHTTAAANTASTAAANNARNAVRTANHMRYVPSMQMSLQMARMPMHMVRMMRMCVRMMTVHARMQMMSVAGAQIVQLVAQYARYRAHTGHVVFVANALGK